MSSQYEEFLNNATVQVVELFTSEVALARLEQHLQSFAQEFTSNMGGLERAETKEAKHWEAVRLNPRLRDKEAGPPDEERPWYWQDDYLGARWPLYKDSLYAVLKLGCWVLADKRIPPNPLDTLWLMFAIPGSGKLLPAGSDGLSVSQEMLWKLRYVLLAILRYSTQVEPDEITRIIEVVWPSEVIQEAVHGFGEWFGSSENAAEMALEGEKRATIQAVLLQVTEDLQTCSTPPIEDPGSAWHREGRGWRVRLTEGKWNTFPDMKGMWYIARLIESVNKPIAAFDLQEELTRSSACDRAPAWAEGSDIDDAVFSLLTKLSAGEAELATDVKTLKAVRDAVEEWQGRFTACTDPQEAVELRDKIDKGNDYLRRNMNYRGKPRLASTDPKERARMAVGKAIRAALKEIKRVDKNLWHHLDASISLGSSCTYSSNPPIPWDVKQ